MSSVANLPDPDEIGEAGFEGVTKAVGSIIDDMRPLLAKKSDKNKKRKRDSSGSSDRSRRRRRGKDDKPDEAGWHGQIVYSPVIKRARKRRKRILKAKTRRT